MDLATLIGLIGAFGIVLTSIILGGSAGTFINTPSLLVVLGGTVMVTMMKFSLGKFLGAASIAVKAFLNKPSSPEDLIETSITFAEGTDSASLPLQWVMVALAMALGLLGVWAVTRSRPATAPTSRAVVLLEVARLDEEYAASQTPTKSEERRYRRRREALLRSLPRS